MQEYKLGNRSRKLSWTKSPEHAEAIQHVILNNYGHLAIKFAEYY